MGLWITLTGVKPYDGRYPMVSDEEMTTREWGWVKRFSGYLPLTIEDGLRGVDAELYAVFAVIALVHAGRAQPTEIQAVFDRLLDAPPFSTFQVENDDDDQAEDGDAGPPARSSNRKSSSSGDESTASSETSPATPAPSGTPDSAASASDPIRLVTSPLRN